MGTLKILVFSKDISLQDVENQESGTDIKKIVIIPLGFLNRGL